MGAISHSILLWVSQNYWVIVLLAMIVYKGNLLFESLFLQPIRGGNGKTQMDELAKYLMLIYLGYIVVKEGESSENYYHDSVVWAFVIGSFLIAGVTEFSDILKSKFGGNK